MARPPRLLPPGAIAHITNRGVGGQDIFLTDGDRTLFLQLVEAEVARREWSCHAYCLMTNHYHLLLQAPDGDLSAGMKVIGVGYAVMFNKVYGRNGHLFQGRFKASRVERDEHVLELARYIALNPVRAGIVKRPERWPWSSYGAAASGTLAGGLRSDWLADRFGGPDALQRFVEAGL
jgi:REP-associated tyrosine transposase